MMTVNLLWILQIEQTFIAKMIILEGASKNKDIMK